MEDISSSCFCVEDANSNDDDEMPMLAMVEGGGGTKADAVARRRRVSVVADAMVCDGGVTWCDVWAFQKRK
jgi:hypothetical protein